MKRLLSLILVLGMLVGMFPLNVLAVEVDPHEETGLSLDSVAWEGLTYRDIFITNNKAYINGFNDKTFSPFLQNTGTNTITTDACYTGPYSLAAFGSPSQQIKSVDTLPIGDYFVASKVYCTRYAAGELGVCLYSSTVGVTETTDGFVTAAGIISAKTEGRIFIGSIHSADLDGYVDDPVVVDLSIFTTRPTGAELTALYETYVDLEKAIEREEIPYTDQECLDAFVEYMNDKATSIGMSSSQFVDPVGIDNITTAADLLRLVVYAYTNYEELREIWGQSSHTVTVRGEKAREQTVVSTVIKPILIPTMNPLLICDSAVHVLPSIGCATILSWKIFGWYAILVRIGFGCLMVPTASLPTLTSIIPMERWIIPLRYSRRHLGIHLLPQRRSMIPFITIRLATTKLVGNLSAMR